MTLTTEPKTYLIERPILGGRVNFPVCLAPMVGMSHVALRLLVRSYLPKEAVTVWPTEMLSTWRLPNEDLGETKETFKGAQETELVPQILGNEEKPIRESVKKLCDWGASGIDINMGCPVRKALKHNYGVALMGDSAYAQEVVHLTVKNSPVPVSVKLRAGLQNDQDYLLNFVKGLELAGASWITLHPRVGHLQRRGVADWAQIKMVRDQVSIPVIGNGDVQCADDVWQMLSQTNCDQVMVGRALAARPWLMWQLGETLGMTSPFLGRQAPQTNEEEGAEFGRALLKFLEFLQTYFEFQEGAKRLRFHLRMTIGWLEFGHHLFAKCAKGHSYPELRQSVEEFFAVEQRMYPRTALRE